MSIEWNEISTKWLLELPCQYEKKELIHAFNVVEHKYGMGFFQSYDSFRGQYFAKLVFNLSTILNEEEKGKIILPKNGEINNTIEHNEVRKSFNLIGLMAHFIRNNLQVESEPIIVVNNKEKKPDFKVKYDELEIYFEETKYEISDRQKELDLILQEISEMLGEVQRSIKIEVIAFADIDESNVNRIKEIVYNQCLIIQQPQLLEIPHFVTVLTYEEGQEKPPIGEVRPAQGMATAIIGSGFIRNLNVLIPFSDSRISNILAKKNQLSSEKCNILVLDLSTSGDLVRISKVLEDVITQEGHKRIGAILLIQKRYYIREVKTEYKFLNNQNAKNPLPPQMIRLIKKYFEDNSSLLIRKINQ